MTCDLNIWFFFFFFFFFFDNLTCRTDCVIFCHLRWNGFWHFENVNIKLESGMRKIQNSGIPITLSKVNKWTQELIQSDPHLAINTKGKDRKIQLSSHKMNRRQTELATFSQNGGNSVTQTKWDILNTHNC